MNIYAFAHPPYRPDLAPCDFCLFPKLTGCRYETTEEMKEDKRGDERGFMGALLGR